MTFRRRGRRAYLLTCAGLAVALGAGSSLLGVCGPFTDVSDAGFCPFVLEIFTLGITTGTTPTTYDPTGNVSRLQMAAFLSRTVDGVLQRGNRRALVKKFWTPQNPLALGLTSVGSPSGILFAASDGKDVWVSNGGSSAVRRVRGSDGKLLETWTGAVNAFGVLVAMGRIFVTGSSSAQSLYRIDPSQPAGAVTTVTSNLQFGSGPLVFDGSRIWVSSSSSVSIVTPGASLPWSVTTVTAGFTSPRSIVYDGANIWTADSVAGTLLKLDANGAILQTVTVGLTPHHPVFDGTNIWVPNSDADSVSVVRASNGSVLSTLTDAGLNDPEQAAFDGQRVLVTNLSGNSVTIWKAANLAPIGTFSTGAATTPIGVCSDGIDFWIVLYGTGQLARF